MQSRADNANDTLMRLNLTMCHLKTSLEEGRSVTGGSEAEMNNCVQAKSSTDVDVAVLEGPYLKFLEVSGTTCVDFNGLWIWPKEKAEGKGRHGDSFSENSF